MTTRRRFLATAAGTATVASLTGCLGTGESGDGGTGEPPGVDPDDELLTSVADPSNQVPPLYFSGYQYQIGELRDKLKLAEAIPRLGGNLVSSLTQQVDGVAVSDLDRVTGSIYFSTTSGGGLQIEPLPSGQSAHATGEFGSSPIVDWLESADGQRSLGESNGFERYLAEIDDGQGFQAVGIRDGTVVVVLRRDVTSRLPEYDTVEETAEDALATEFEQLGREDAPITTKVPNFARAVSSLETGPIRAGTKYALIPLGADSGTTAFDDVVTGVTGAGISATPGDTTRIQRSLAYLDAEMMTEETVRTAYDALETGKTPVDAWDFSPNEETITASATVEGVPSPAILQTGLPVPGYESLFRRVDPRALGRNPPPRLLIQPTIEDGTLQLRHGGVDTVDELEIRYVHDGAVQRESWTGPIERGDQFTSEQSVDSETKIWATWQPETVHAAVVMFRDAR